MLVFASLGPPRFVLLAALTTHFASCASGSDMLSGPRFPQCGDAFQNLMTVTLVPQAGSAQMVELCVSSWPSVFWSEDASGPLVSCATREYKVQGATEGVIRFATTMQNPLPCASDPWVAGEFLDGGGTLVTISGTYNGPAATPWADGAYTKDADSGTFRIAQ